MTNLIKSMIFPTIVWKYYEVVTQENCNKINDFCKKVQKNHSVATLQHLDIFKNLHHQVLKLSQDWMSDFKWNYDELVISNMWANNLKPGKTHRPHSHPNNLLSGVFYPESNDAPITFLDPRTQASVLNPSFHEANVINSNIWSYPSEKNTLLLFPSWLMHYVEDIKSPRVSVSFNVMVKGSLGKSEEFTKANF